jgi:hypothetical protein
MRAPRTLTLLLTLSVGAAMALPAFASGPTIVATPNPVDAGAIVTLHGTLHGCPGPDPLMLLSNAFARTHEFAGVPAVYATVHAGGAYSVRTRIPSSKHGNYSISGRCGGGNIGVVRILRVH